MRAGGSTHPLGHTGRGQPAIQSTIQQRHRVAEPGIMRQLGTASESCVNKIGGGGGGGKNSPHEAPQALHKLHCVELRVRPPDEGRPRHQHPHHRQPGGRGLMRGTGPLWTHTHLTVGTGSVSTTSSRKSSSAWPCSTRTVL